MKAALRGKLIALSASKKKLERVYTSNLTAQLKALEQKEGDTHKRSTLQEILKLGVEMDQIETKRTIQSINKTKSWLFEKIKKIQKQLASLTSGQRESKKLTKSERRVEI